MKTALLVRSAALIFAVGTTLLFQKEASATQPTIAGTCATTATRFKISKNLQSTTSTSFIAVLETGLNFVQGGTRPSCVIVSFSAEASTSANGVMFVYPVLDDNVACQPMSTGFDQSDATPDGLRARAMNYVCTDVAPGAHTIKMVFSASAGATVTLDFRTMLVHYVQ